MPPLILLGALLIAVGFEWLIPLGILPPALAGWPLAVGMTLAVLSIALAGWAADTFRRIGTDPSPHRPTTAVATAGPYRFTRNPIYLGFLLLFIGVSVAFSLDWGVVLTPLLAIVLHVGVVLREERYLTRKFGDEYRAYQDGTRRWL